MRERLAIAVVLTVAVVAVGALVASRWLGEPAPEVSAPVDAAPARAPVVETAAQRVVVTAVTGAPERQRPNAPSAPLKQGDVLAGDEIIRTGEHGGAALKVGDVAEVEVAARSQLAIGQLADRVSRLELGRGRIAAVVHGREAARLRVEVGGSGAAAESQDGSFSMLATDGQVTLATTKGSAQLSARGRTVDVGAGFQSTARKDAAPSAPAAIPPSLFIKLAPPRNKVQREKQTVVSGRTTPGALVSINGTTVAAGDDGAFSRAVPLREGKNVVRVESEDALGRRRAQALPAITVDSKAPDVQTTVKW